MNSKLVTVLVILAILALNLVVPRRGVINW